MRINLLVLSFLLFTSCLKKDFEVQEVKNYLINDLRISSLDKIIVIIPLDECSVCLEEIKQNLIENKKKKIKIVLVSYFNRKIKQYKKDFDKSHIIIVDSTGSGYKHKFLYSPVLLDNKGRLIRYSFENDTFLKAIREENN